MSSVILDLLGFVFPALVFVALVRSFRSNAPRPVRTSWQLAGRPLMRPNGFVSYFFIAFVVGLSVARLLQQLLAAQDPDSGHRWILVAGVVGAVFTLVVPGRFEHWMALAAILAEVYGLTLDPRGVRFALVVALVTGAALAVQIAGIRRGALIGFALVQLMVLWLGSPAHLGRAAGHWSVVGVCLAIILILVVSSIVGYVATFQDRFALAVLGLLLAFFGLKLVTREWGWAQSADIRFAFGVAALHALVSALGRQFVAGESLPPRPEEAARGRGTLERSEREQV